MACIALRTGTPGNYDVCTYKELRSELFTEVLGAGRFLWNLTHNSITPQGALLLFEHLSNQEELTKKVLAVDLAYNQLQDMTAEQFGTIFDIMIGKLPHVMVRFGPEIFPPDLHQALSARNAEALLTKRVHIQQPWADSLDLSETLAKLTAMVEDSEQETDDEREDLTGYADVKSPDQDIQILECVAKQLGGAVVCGRYNFQGLRIDYEGEIDTNGGVDGIIAVPGRKPVIVLVELAPDVEKYYFKAIQELYRACGHWDKLCKLTPEEMTRMPEKAADFRAMHVEKYRNWDVKFAFGGRNYPPETHCFAKTCGWFIITEEAEGQYKVVHECLSRSTTSWMDVVFR